MIHQQINLYQPGFRRQRNVFSGTAMLQVAGVVLGGLLAMYGYASWQVHGLNLERSTLADQRDVITKTVEQLSQKYPAKKKSKLLEQEIARLTAERDQSRRLIDILAGRTLGDTQGIWRPSRGTCTSSREWHMAHGSDYRGRWRGRRSTRHCVVSGPGAPVHPTSV